LLETFTETTILLIDTYDSQAEAETAARLGRKIKGVRLDSGDLLEKSRQVRQILDRHGLRDTTIFGSGDLNEYKIEELVAKGAPIDAFGVGTDLATSRDVPALGVVYKLVEVERNGHVEYKTKFSEKKAHWPGRKQVFRFSRPVAGKGGRGDGREAQARPERSERGAREEFHHDLIARANEDYPEAAPLLDLMMREGR